MKRDIKFFLYHWKTIPLKDKLIPGTLSTLVLYGNINFLANEQRRIWSGMIVTQSEICIIRPVGAKDAGDARATMAPPYFDRSVNTFQPGGKTMPTTLLLPHRIFKASKKDDIFRPSYSSEFIDALIRKGYLRRDRNRRYATGHQKSVSFSPLSFPIVTL